jgi:hypothetical protein
VKVTDVEIDRIAAFLGIATDEFIQRHTRMNAARNGLALLDQPDGSCAFLEGNQCRINPVKPAQCRDFPNLWNFPGFTETCRAKPIEMSPDAWRRKIHEATGRSVEPPEETR